MTQILIILFINFANIATKELIKKKKENLTKVTKQAVIIVNRKSVYNHSLLTVGFCAEQKLKVFKIIFRAILSLEVFC